jgi:phosphate transport system permease protein
MALPATEQEQTAGLRHEIVTAASISRPPSTWDIVMDRLFRGLTLVFAALTIVLVLYILVEIGGKAAPAVQQYGISFMTSTTWDVNKGRFGVLPEIWGTLYSSVLALLLGDSSASPLPSFSPKTFCRLKLK